LSNLSVAGFAATAPLLGEVASSVSEDDGEVIQSRALPSEQEFKFNVSIPRRRHVLLRGIVLFGQTQ